MREKEKSVKSKGSIIETNSVSKKTGGGKLDLRIDKIEKYLADRFDWLGVNLKNKEKI